MSAKSFPRSVVISGVDEVAVDFQDGVDDKSGVYFKGIVMQIKEMGGTSRMVYIAGGKGLEFYVNGNQMKHKCRGEINEDIFV